MADAVATQSADATGAAAAAAAAAGGAKGNLSTTNGGDAGPGSSVEAEKVASGDPNSISSSIIDMDIFGQLLEMDDEEDREFSKEIVWNYFDQAETTFAKMEDAFKSNNLLELSTLGHFLKGSSAAVGVIKVRDSCENMQHYGKKVDKDGITTLSEEDAVSKLRTTLTDVKQEYKEAEVALRKFYADTE